jgi:phage gp37-like protein
MIGAIENAMLARVKTATAARALGYDISTFETWPRQFDEYQAERVIKFPAVWAAFGGVHKAERIARGRHRFHATFALVVAAKNVRNEESRRHGGSPSEVGSYQMACDMARLLADQTLGLDIDALQPVSMQMVDVADIPTLKQISMYSVGFETGFYLDAMANVSPAEALAAFKIFHANWDPAPFGHVDADPTTPGVQIPDDVHAVGSDSIILDQDT